MNNRNLIVNIHLALACFFLPLMLILPLTGTLHLWEVADRQDKVEAFRISGTVPQDNQDSFFRDVFKKQNIDFDFEYIRNNKNDYTFRPTSREYYTATQEGEEIVFKKVTPNWNLRLMELHKGHGPRLFRTLESLFGIFLILVTISGLWLSLTVKTYRRVTFISFFLGAVVIVYCLM